MSPVQKPDLPPSHWKDDAQPDAAPYAVRRRIRKTWERRRAEGGATRASTAWFFYGPYAEHLAHTRVVYFEGAMDRDLTDYQKSLIYIEVIQ